MYDIIKLAGVMSESIDVAYCFCFVSNIESCKCEMWKVICSRFKRTNTERIIYKSIEILVSLYSANTL